MLERNLKTYDSVTMVKGCLHTACKIIVYDDERKNKNDLKSGTLTSSMFSIKITWHEKKYRKMAWCSMYNSDLFYFSKKDPALTRLYYGSMKHNIYSKTFIKKWWNCDINIWKKF